ncbi:hypothetical protein LJC55_03250, partial [Eubacteriales bacterium OttesenSCG-928-N14]|nr:hypothetical protein [Eubacteriales bacterium OttesenSCG-928-N14]
GMLSSAGEKIRMNKHSPALLCMAFNHQTYCTEMFVQSKHEGIVRRRDITKGGVTDARIDFAERINNSIQLRAALAKAFGKLYATGKIPFAADELSLELLVLLNCFQGFPKDFYDSIPIDYTTMRLVDGFEKAAAELHHYDNVPLLLFRLGLPPKKCIKRAVYQNPALFFYAEQIQQLPFRNIDQLANMLASKKIFHLLTMLKSYPGIYAYLQALVIEKGEDYVWQMIVSSIHLLPKAAAQYLMLPKEKQEEVLKKKSRQLHSEYEKMVRHIPEYNIPMQQDGGRESKSDTIDGYVFKTITNTLDLNRAAKALHNCLSDCIDRQIIGIQKNGKYVAAMEVVGNAVVEATMANNDPIEQDEKLLLAAKEWMRLNELKYRPECYPLNPLELL